MKKRILICDDDADTREVISLILKKHGYDVEPVENGRVLLEIAKQMKPDLIFLDMLMPELAGKDAIKQLREMPETKSIPVLILSALSNGEHVARQIGAEAYISKPFDIKLLIEQVKRMID